jgi:hypothetical protein
VPGRFPRELLPPDGPKRLLPIPWARLCGSVNSKYFSPGFAANKNNPILIRSGFPVELNPIIIDKESLLKSDHVRDV